VALLLAQYGARSVVGIRIQMPLLLPMPMLTPMPLSSQFYSHLLLLRHPQTQHRPSHSPPCLVKSPPYKPPHPHPSSLHSATRVVNTATSQKHSRDHSHHRLWSARGLFHSRVCVALQFDVYRVFTFSFSPNRLYLQHYHLVQRIEAAPRQLLLFEAE